MVHILLINWYSSVDSAIKTKNVHINVLSNRLKNNFITNNDQFDDVIDGNPLFYSKKWASCFYSVPLNNFYFVHYCETSLNVMF